MEFRLNSERFRAALRAVLAGVIVLLVAQALRLEHSNWSLLTVLVLIQPRARATYQKGIYRVIGTLLGAGLAVFLLELFPQEPVLLFAGLAACFFPLFYLMSGKLLPYSFLMAGFTLIMVATPGLSQPESSLITGVYRSTEILLGVAASVFVTLWLWPQSAESSLRWTISEFAAVLRRALALRFQEVEGGAGESLEKIRRDALELLEQFPVLADQTILEGSLDQDRQQNLLRSVHAWEALSQSIFEWVDTPVDLVRARTKSGEEGDLRKFASCLDRLLRALQDDPHAEPGDLLAEMEEIEKRLLDLLAEQRAAGWSKNFKVAENFSYYRVLEALKNSRISAAGLALPRLASAPLSNLGKDMPVWSRLPQEIWADLKSPDPARLHLAIKTAALFMGMLVASQAFHLDFMLQAMITALLVLSQSTVGSTVHKALMRLLGAVAGGLMALAVLTLFGNELNSLAVLIVLTGGVMFVASYVSNGPPSYNYLGIQGGLAFFLTMFSGFAPPLTVDPAVERFAGVILGSVLAILLTTSVMPAHAGSEYADHLRRLREHLVKAFRKIRKGPEMPGSEGAEVELELCRKELVNASNFLLHSRIEGAMEQRDSSQGVKDLEQLRKIYQLMRDLNQVPPVLQRLPQDHHLTRVVGEAMDSIESRILDPASSDVFGMKALSDAVLRARREGTLTAWDARDVTAAGASMYLVGQMLSMQAPPIDLSMAAGEVGE